MTFNIKRSAGYDGTASFRSRGAGGGINVRFVVQDSLTPAIDPGSLPNLSAWYKADALAFSNGATVTSWTDSSANGNTLNTYAGTPVYNSSDPLFNNKPSVTFNGSSWLYRSSPTSFPVGTAPASTMYMVGYATNLGNVQSLGGFGNNIGLRRINFYSDSTGVNDVYIMEYTNSVTDGVVTTMGVPVIMSHHLPAGYNNSESYFYLNNAIVRSGVVADGQVIISSPPSMIMLGTLPDFLGAGYGLTGKIAEFIVYNGYHDDDTRAGVAQYLSNKYGIAIASVANQITTNAGLILNYDIGNAVSYPGSGTTVNDLRNNSAASLINSPTYSAGYLTFNGTNQALITSTDLKGIRNLFLGTSPNVSEVTSLFMWVYPSSAGNILVERGSTNHLDQSGVWAASNIEINSSGNFSFGTWNGSNMNDKVVSTAQSFNTWYYVGWTYDGATLTAYINGVAVGSVTFNRAAPYNAGFEIHYSIASPAATNMGTNSYCNMRLGAFQIYNASLTAAQVLKNYNVTKATYGL